MHRWRRPIRRRRPRRRQQQRRQQQQQQLQQRRKQQRQLLQLRRLLQQLLRQLPEQLSRSASGGTLQIRQPSAPLSFPLREMRVSLLVAHIVITFPSFCSHFAHYHFEPLWRAATSETTCAMHLRLAWGKLCLLCSTVEPSLGGCWLRPLPAAHVCPAFAACCGNADIASLGLAAPQLKCLCCPLQSAGLDAVTWETVSSRANAHLS